MQDQEKQNLLTNLETGHRLLLYVLTGVTEDLASRAPASGRWSVLECVEHVAVSEDYLFSQIQASSAAQAPLINREREERIAAVGLDRTRKIQAPKEGQPSGRFATLADAVEHFSATRRRAIEFVKSSQEDLRCRLTSHPIIGTANCYEMLLMIAVHPFRHAKQIEEIKMAFGS